MRRVRRRQFLVAASAILASPFAAEAQRPDSGRRIGFLVGSDSTVPEIEGFRLGLREHGYVEGENLLVEWRFAEGRGDRLQGLAAELVNQKVLVLVTSSGPAATAAIKA